MSTTYSMRGQRYLRKYTAAKLTPSYASASEAATIASTLCDVKWSKAPNVNPCFPIHPGSADTEEIDQGNVAAREYYDAVLFCADHNDDVKAHRAYANAACYKFTLPDLALGESARKLENLSVAVNCDPYTGAGARIAVYTNDTGIIPKECKICRNGSLYDDTDPTKQSHSPGSTVWSSTNTHVEGAAPRTVGNDGLWYAGAGTAVIAPTGGLTLGKYLFVFVLLENYNFARNGFLEGSAFIQQTVTATFTNSIAGWSTETYNDTSSDPEEESAVVVCAGHVPTKSAADCTDVEGVAFVTKTPASDVCMPSLETVKLSYDGSNERGIFLSGNPVVDLVKSALSGPYVQSVLTKQKFGTSPSGSFSTLQGPPQSVYAWDDEIALIAQEKAIDPSKNDSSSWSKGYQAASGMHLPLFNSQIMYRDPDWGTASRRVGYWFAADYLSTGAKLGNMTGYELPPLATSQMKLRADGSVMASEGSPITVEHPYAANLNPDRVTFGTGPSSLGCVLHPSRINDTVSELPGLDFFIASSKSGNVTSHPSAVTDHIDFVKSIAVFGSDTMKTTAAYRLLKSGKATGAFIGDCAGNDSNSLAVGMHIDSEGAAYLKKALLRKDGVFYYDAVKRSNTIIHQMKTFAANYYEWNVETTSPSYVSGGTLGTSQLRIWANFNRASAGGGWTTDTTWEFGHPQTLSTGAKAPGTYSFSHHLVNVNPDERAALDTFLNAYYGFDLDEYFDSGASNVYVERYLGTQGSGSNAPCPVWRSYLSQDSSVEAYNTSFTYPVFVTDGNHTYLAAYLRLATRTCYDIVRYPSDTVLDQDKLDIVKCNVSYTAYGMVQSTMDFASNMDLYTDVPLLYLVPYNGTFVQLWAPDEGTASIDFGPASSMAHVNTLGVKDPGPYFNYDAATGVVTPDRYSFKDYQKTVAFSNGSSGSGSITISHVDPADTSESSAELVTKTIEVTGTVDTLVPDPSSDGVIYAFGQFTKVGETSCANVVKINVNGANPVVSTVAWDSDVAMTMVRSGVRDYALSPAALCAASGTYASDELLLTGGVATVGSVSKTGRVVKISPSSATHVSEIASDQFLNLDNVTPFSIFSGTSIDYPSVFSCSGSAGGYYTADVYRDVSYMEDVTGLGALVGLNACYARMMSSLVEPVSCPDALTKGMSFSLSFDSAALPTLVKDASGNTVVGSVSKPVWSLVMSVMCIPFASMSDSVASRIRLRWSSVEMHGFGDSPTSVRNTSYSAGSKVRVWLNRVERVGSLSDFNPGFFDVRSGMIGNWEYVGTIDDLFGKTSAEFSVNPITNRVGTVLLVGWVPPESVEASDADTGFAAGVGAAYHDDVSGITVVDGWLPDVELLT